MERLRLMVGDSLLAGYFGVVVDEVISAARRRGWRIKTSKTVFVVMA